MSNVFRSKEIFKRLPRVPTDQNPLRVVRGVYISGTPRAVQYIDSGIRIKNINTKTASIVDFSTKYSSVENNALNLCGVSFGGTIISEYGTKNSTVENNALNLFSVSFGNTTIVDYATINTSAIDDSLHLMSIQFTNDSIFWYDNKKIESNKDFIIRIKSISTTQATISNV